MAKFFVDEVPIDITTEIKIWLLDSMQKQRLEITDYNISPKKII